MCFQPIIPEILLLSQNVTKAPQREIPFLEYLSKLLQQKLFKILLRAKFYCLHALADGKQHIQIREKMLEFSSLSLQLEEHTNEDLT